MDVENNGQTHFDCPNTFTTWLLSVGIHNFGLPSGGLDVNAWVLLPNILHQAHL